MTIREYPVIDTLDVAYQAASGQWVDLNNKATKVDVKRGGKRAGVSNSIDVGSMSLELFGAVDLDTSSALRPNVPIRVAGRDGKPGQTIESTQGFFSVYSQSGFTAQTANQARPALDGVPAGTRWSWSVSIAANTTATLTTSPYPRASRSINAVTLQLGRRYAVSARVNDWDAETAVPLRFAIYYNPTQSSPLTATTVVARGDIRPTDATRYSDLPPVSWEVTESTGYYIIVVEAAKAITHPAGAARVVSGFSFFDYKYALLPQEPTAVFTGTIADLTQRPEFDKNTGTKRIFTSIYAVDAVQPLAATQRYGAIVEDGAAHESWEDRIGRLAASSPVPVTIPQATGKRWVHAWNGYSLDGWKAVAGPLAPAAMGTASTTVPANIWPARNVIHVHYRKTDAAVSCAPGTMGIERVITGLTPGASYVFVANATVWNNSTPVATDIRIGVAGIGAAASAVVPLSPAGVTLPSFSFTATGTTHTVQITNSASISLAGGNYISWQLNAMGVLQIGVQTPYRLQSTVYESSLASHFDLACNSTGARWWVDSQNVVQFRGYSEASAPVGVWTDNPDDAKVFVPAGNVELRRNLFPVPSMESSTTVPTSQATAVYSTAWKQFGTRSVRLQPNSASNQSYAAIGMGSTPLVPGKTYTASAYVHTPVAQTGTLYPSARRISVQVTRTGQSSLAYYSQLAPEVGTGRISVTFTAPVGANGGFVFLFNGADNSSNNYVYFDGILVEEASDVNDYFDGSFPASGDISYSWAGTANESSSIMNQAQADHFIDNPLFQEYVDINTAFDTKALVTELTFDQHGMVVEDGEAKALDYKETYRDGPGAARWGVRGGSLGTSLYAGQGFENALSLRAQDVFNEVGTARTITGFRWNAQEDATAALALDIYDRVQVQYGVMPVDAEIISLKHSITPTRWMVDIELTNTNTGVTFEKFNTALGSRTFAELNTLLGGKTFAQFAADPLNGLTS